MGGEARNQMNPFEALGLPQNATPVQVKAAWRLRIAEPGVHPDLGGDVESFLRLREMYERALFISENAPCETCGGTGSVGAARSSFTKALMRCTACGGSGKRR